MNWAMILGIPLGILLGYIAFLFLIAAITWIGDMILTTVEKRRQR